MNNVISLVYLITAFLLIVGLRQMSSPKTAKGGIMIAGWGMFLADINNLFNPNYSRAQQLYTDHHCDGAWRRDRLVLRHQSHHDPNATDDCNI